MGRNSMRRGVMGASTKEAIRGQATGVGMRALVGAVAGFPSGGKDCTDEGWFCLEYTRGEATGFGAVTYGAPSAVSGLILGV